MQRAKVHGGQVVCGLRFNSGARRVARSELWYHTFQRLLAAALMALGASTLPARAAPVFMDTFATSTLNSNVNAPTGTSTNYVIASSKNATGSTIGSGDLKIPIASTSGLLGSMNRGSVPAGSTITPLAESRLS